MPKPKKKTASWDEVKRLASERQGEDFSGVEERVKPIRERMAAQEFNTAYDNLYRQYNDIVNKTKSGAGVSQRDYEDYKKSLDRTNYMLGRDVYQRGIDNYYGIGARDKIRQGVNDVDNKDLQDWYSDYTHTSDYQNASYDEKQRILGEKTKETKKNKAEAILDYLSGALGASAAGNMYNAAPTERNLQALEANQALTLNNVANVKQLQQQENRYNNMRADLYNENITQKNLEKIDGDQELYALVEDAVNKKYIADANSNANAMLNSGGMPKIGASDDYAQYTEARNRIANKGYNQKEIDSLMESFMRRQNAQEAERQNAAIAEFATSHPGLASAAYVGANVLQAGAVPQIIQGGATALLNNEYKPLDVNTNEFAATRFRDAVSNTVSENLKEEVLKNTDSEFWANGAQFVYQTGLSIGDFASLAFLPEPVSLAIMGTSAGVAAVKDATDRGLSADKALATGLAAGAAEIVFEKLSLENFNALKANGKSGVLNWVKDVLKQSFTEGSEEVFTDVANAITDQLINHDRSELSMQYQALLQEYNGDEEAAQKALAQQFGLQLAQSFAGGALSGAVMGNVGRTVNAINSYRAGAEIANNRKELDALKNVAAMSKNENTIKSLEKVEGGKAKAATVGKLYNAVAEEIVETFNSADNITQLTNEYEKVMRRASGSLSQIATQAYFNRANEITSQNNKNTSQKPQESETGSLDAIDKVFSIPVATSDGNEVTAVSVANVDNGFVTFNTSDGGTIDERDVKGQNAALDRVIDRATEETHGVTLGNKGAEVYIANAMNTNADEQTFDQYAKAVYEAGANGTLSFQQLSQNEATAPMVNALGAETAKAMYNAGRTDANITTVAEVKQKYDAALKAKKKPGVTNLSTQATMMQQEELSLLNDVAKHFGHEIIVVDRTLDVENGVDVNGAYTKGKIILALDNESGLLSAYLGHEMVHSFKETAREQYNALEQFVIERLQEKASYDLDEQIQHQIDLNNGFDTEDEARQREYAIEEIVANSAFTVLSERENVELLAQENKPLLQKIRDFFADWIKEVRKALERLALSNKEYEALHDDLEAKKKILALFNECLKAQQGVTAGNAEVKASAKESAYMEAAQNGDEATAQRLVDEAAMEWGAYSVDGKTPLKLYHGTHSRFTVFDINKTSSANAFGRGHYFTTSRRDAEENYASSTGADVQAKIDDLFYYYWDEMGHDVDELYTNDFDEDDYNLAYDKAEAAYSRGQVIEVYVKADRFARVDRYGSVFDGNGNKIAGIYGISQQGITDRLISAGYHGIIADDVSEMFANVDANTSHIVVFDSNQIKSADPITYDDNGDVIPLDERFSDSKDIRYSQKETDSEGNELSKQQQEYFKDSKVRDDEGRLKVVYHGTDSDFHTFNSAYIGDDNKLGIGFYFLLKPLEFSYEHPKAVYLNITNPITEESNIVPKEKWIKFFDVVGVDTVYDAESDISNYIRASYDYQGDNQSFLNAANDILGIDGIIATTNRNSAVAFNSNQAKLIDNTTPTDNPDIRFSMKENVEQTRDLIAVHNLNEESLMKSLQLGGLPMPSIAVMRAESSANEGYGEISLVFPTDTIDPKKNKNNKVYGLDVWSPTYPTIYYKPNSKVVNNISNKYYTLRQQYGEKVRPLYKYAENMENELSRYRGEKGLKEDAYENTDLMNVFLIDTTGKAVDNVYKEETTTMNPAQAAFYQSMIDTLGVDFVENAVTYKNGNLQGFKENADTIKAAYAKALKQTDGLSDAEIENELNNVSNNVLFREFLAARKYYYNGDTTVNREYDREGTFKAIKEAVNLTDYKKWVDKLFNGVEEKRGIYNGKDVITNNGRRTWEQLHYEETLENVVKVMKQQKNGQGALFSGTGLWAVAAKDYGTIDEIRADKDRLQILNDEEYNAIKEEIGNRFSELAHILANVDDEDNYFIAADTAYANILDAVSTNRTKSAAMAQLKEYYGDVVTESFMDDVLNMIADAGNMPTGYFEAKPRRAVRFNEVYTAVIPDNSSAELKDALKDAGVDYRTYKAGDENARVEVLNSLDEAKFSRKENVVDVNRVLDENEELRDAMTELKTALEIATKNNEKLKNEFKITDRHNLSNNGVSKIATWMRKEYGSNYSKQELTERLMQLYDYMVNAGVDINMDYIMQTARDIGFDILAGTNYIDDSMKQQYADVIARIRSTPIYASDEVKAIDDYNYFRKHSFGRIRLVNDPAAMGVDELYSELSNEGIVSGEASGVESQLYEIIDFLDSTKPVVRNAAEERIAAEGMERDALANIVASDIFDKFFDVPETQTFAERQKKKFDQARLEYQNKIDDLKAIYQDVIDDLNAQHSADVERIKEKHAEEIAETKEHAAEIAKRKIERRKTAEIRARIRRLKANLDKRLIKPTDTGYVPKPLVKAVIDVCDMLTEAERFWKNGNEKGASTQLRLDNLVRKYQDLKTDADFGYASEYDEDFYDMVNDLADKLGGKQISELSLKEITEVYDALKVIYDSLLSATKQIGTDEKIASHQLAVQMIKEVEASAGRGRTIAGRYEAYTLNPIRYIRKISEYNDDAVLVKLVDALEQGVFSANKFRADAAKPFLKLQTQNKGKDYKAFTQDLKDFGIKDENGKPVMMTENQAVQLYMTALREEGLYHLSKGGARIADLKLQLKGNNKEARAKGAKAAEGQADAILNIRKKLSGYGMDWVNASKHLFDVEAKNAINDASMQLRHRRIATSKNYITLEVESTQLNKEIEALVNNATIEGDGRTKSTVKNAGQSVVIRGIAEVVDGQIDFAAKYGNLAVPIKNFNRVYNGRTSQYYDADMKQTTVKEALESKWGTQTTGLIESLLTDLQSSSARKPKLFGNDFVSPAVSKLQSNFVAATLASNLQVAIKQAASYPTAGSILSTKSLARGVRGFAQGKKGEAIWNEIDEHTGLHFIRRIGYSVPELGELKEQHSWLNKLPKGVNPMNWIQAIDTGTTAALWVATKAEVESTMPELKKGSAAYWDAVVSMYEDVITETQPNYDVIHRPEMQKTGNLLAKSLFMFRTQPLQNSGILYDSVFELRQMQKNYKENGSDANKRALEASQKKFRKALASQITSALVFTGMTLLGQAIKHTMFGYRDDDDEVTLESVTAGWLKSIIGYTIGEILPLGGSELVSLVDRIRGESTYDVLSVPAVNTVNEYIDAIGKVYKSVEEARDAVKNKESADAKRIVDALTGLLTQSVDLAGLPASNAYAMARGFVYHAIDLTNGEFGSFKAGINHKGSSGYQELYEYKSSDNKEGYDRAYQALVDSGKTATQIRNGLVDALIDNDIRVAEAGMAYLDGDMNKMIDTVNALIADGYTEAQAHKAITKYAGSIEKARDYYENDEMRKYNAEVDALVKSGIDRAIIEKAISDVDYVPDDGSDKTSQIYKYDEMIGALDSGNTAAYKQMYNSIVDIQQQNGKTKEEAEKSVKSKINSHYKQDYIDNPGKRSSIESKLNATGLYSSDDYNEWVVDSLGTEAMVTAFEQGESATKQYVSDRIEAKVNTGMDAQSAAYGIKTSISNKYRKAFIEGDDQTRMQIITYMTNTGLYGSRQDVVKYVNKNWLK